jgi:hypothetical protein
MVLVAPSMKPDAPAFEANSLRLKATPALLRKPTLVRRLTDAEMHFGSADIRS